MNSHVDSRETRAIGWYAIHWTRLADWFRTRSRQVGDTFEKNSESTTQKKESETQKLQEVVDESHNVLARAKTVWPFTLFPSRVSIDRHKLTIVCSQFVNEQTVSVPIEDIKNVQADVGPFFGTLRITSDLFINNTQTIKYLPAHDVRKIQKLVQGAMVALKEHIDINKISTKDLVKLLTELGKGHADGKPR